MERKKSERIATTQEERSRFTSRQLVDPGSVVLGIGGGVGPSAGVGLHQKIIDNTRSKTDQGHFTVVHISRSAHIQDRTKFLLGEIEINPGVGMAEAVWAIGAAAKANGELAVVCVPCNTFHAPPVWRQYVEHLKALGADGTTLRLIHMLDETVDMIKEAVPGCKKIGLMSTTGTRESRVYRDLLEPQGYEVLEVPPEQQAEVHETIYNQDWGIKAVSPITLKAVQNFRSYASVLKEMGAEAIILGCTEIPLALPEPDYEGVPLIDPVEAGARAMITLADQSKLLPRGGGHEFEQIHFQRLSATSSAFSTAQVVSVAKKWKKRANAIIDAREDELDSIDKTIDDSAPSPSASDAGLESKPAAGWLAVGVVAACLALWGARSRQAQ